MRAGGTEKQLIGKNKEFCELCHSQPPYEKTIFVTNPRSKEEGKQNALPKVSTEKEAFLEAESHSTLFTFQ